jgi:hypothetical protein
VYRQEIDDVLRQTIAGILLTSASVLLTAADAEAADKGELTLLAGYSTGDYGTDVDSDTEFFALRYVVGKAVRFRVQQYVLRIDPIGSVVPTGSGLSPRGRRKRESTADGGEGMPGSGSGSGNGPGSGSGDVTIDDPAQDELELGSSSGLGDLVVAATRTFAGGGARRFRLDAGVQAKAPVADEQEGLGTGEWDFRLGASTEYRGWSVTMFGGAGWNRLGDPDWIDLNDVFDAYVGLEGDAFGERVTLSGWIDGHEEIVDGDGTAATLGFEARAIGGPRWRVGLTAGLGDGAADYGVLLGYSFSIGRDSSSYRGMLR